MACRLHSVQQITLQCETNWNARYNGSPPTPRRLRAGRGRPMAEIVDVSAVLRVLDEVDNERQRQDDKWGQQNHHPFTWLAILGEEMGEANQAALQATFDGKTWADYRKE